MDRIEVYMTRDNTYRFTSLVISRKSPTENPSGNVGLVFGAFLISTELFDRGQSDCCISNYFY